MNERFGFTSNVNDLMDDGDPTVAINWHTGAVVEREAVGELMQGEQPSMDSDAEDDRWADYLACLASENRAEMIAHGGSDGLWFDR